MSDDGNIIMIYESWSPNNFRMIMQVLARKGIFVAEPADCSLTETVLIQTTPLKMVMKS